VGTSAQLIDVVICLFASMLVYEMLSHMQGSGTDVGIKERWGWMASAEHELIMRVWGQSPQWGPGAEPLVSGSRGKAP